MPTSSIRSFTAPAPWSAQSIPHGDGALGARLYRAAGDAPRALLLHFHAGAFTGGTLASGAAVAQALAGAGATVLSLDYPLAPAHPFPAAVQAGYAALQWLQRQRRRLARAQTPLLVAGEEAGGNIAAAVALMARDRGGPALAGQLLLSPMLDVCVATASQRQAHAGPVGCAYADGWRAYLAAASDATHPYATPGTSLRLTGLPRTWLLSADDDPLRDETLAYARRLQAAGVDAAVHVLPAPTGWPLSYQHTAAEQPPVWAAPLQDLLQRVLQTASVPNAPHNTAHSSL